jgi:hypothetical protein
LDLEPARGTPARGWLQTHRAERQQLSRERENISCLNSSGDGAQWRKNGAFDTSSAKTKASSESNKKLSECECLRFPKHVLGQNKSKKIEGFLGD